MRSFATGFLLVLCVSLIGAMAIFPSEESVAPEARVIGESSVGVAKPEVDIEPDTEQVRMDQQLALIAKLAPDLEVDKWLSQHPIVQQLSGEVENLQSLGEAIERCFADGRGNRGVVDRRLQQAETRLAETKAMLVGRLYHTLQAEADDWRNAAEAPDGVPRGWSKRHFNGMTYYIVPLGSEGDADQRVALID